MDEKSLDRAIGEIAEECGIVLKDGSPGFAFYKPLEPLNIGEALGYADAVWPWRRLMAECINYLSIQGLAAERAVDRATDPEDLAFARAIWSLSSKASSDAQGVLHLADHGFSAQCAIVGRSCIEAIEALCLFVVDPSGAEEFVKAATVDEINHVWFQHIRRRARKSIEAALSTVVEIDVQTTEWQKENSRFLGAMTHPSYVGPFLNIYTKWEPGREGFPMTPARTLDCVRTYRSIAWACFEHASVVLLVVGKTRKRRRANVTKRKTSRRQYKSAGFFEEDWLDSYASRGHAFMQHLWVHYMRCDHRAPYSAWRKEQPTA